MITVTTECAGRLEILAMEKRMVVWAIDIPGFKTDPITMDMANGYDGRQVVHDFDWESWAKDWFFEDDEEPPK